MTALETMRDFIASYPHADVLEGFYVDYTDQIADCAGLFPSGLVEVSRARDIVGGVTVQNQYNFALYTVLAKSPKDDEGATYNAEWLMDFQEWIQEQSVRGLAPTFGDIPEREVVRAQNGQLYSAEDEGTAMYVVQVSATFYKEFN